MKLIPRKNYIQALAGSVVALSPFGDAVQAQDSPVRPAVPSPVAPATPAGSGTPPVAPDDVLTLDEVLSVAEQNHPRLRGGEADRLAATARRSSTQGAFDPVPFFGSVYQRYNSTSTRGKPQYTSMNDVGVEFPFRNGIRVTAGTRLNLGNPKSPESSTGDAGEWNVAIKAPLGRGYGINAKTVAEQQALLGEPIAAQNLALTRLDVLRQASLAYWTWVAAGQKVTVARNLLTISQTRADQIRRRFERGDLPEIDAVEATGEVFRRQGALTAAERAQQSAAFRLSLFLWGEGAANVVPAPDTFPAEFPPVTALTPEAVAEGRERAAARNPQAQIVRLRQQSARLDERLAENDRRPQVDLVFNPGLDSGNKGIDETVKAGIEFSVPLGVREATGRRDAARFTVERLRQEERLLVGQLQTEVNDAANAVELTRQRYDAAVQEVALAERLEQAERRRYELGEGTIFLINQRERATAEARQRLIDVLAEYQQALAAFRAASLLL